MARLLFISDPLDGFKIHKDSTFAMMQAAQHRGHSVWWATAQALSCAWRGGVARPSVAAQSIRLLGQGHHQGQTSPWWSVVEAAALAPTDIDVILMRKDPPFDVTYLVATQMLELFERLGVHVINRPQALRDHGEKLSALEFTRWAPPGLVSASISELRAFAAEHPMVVYKPLDAMGGSGVFVTQADDPNLPVILETLTDMGSRAIMAQQHLSAIVDGDKRILLINGQPIAQVLARIPPKGASRGNLAAGGRGEARPLTARDFEIAQDLGPILASRGLFLVGLDVIGEHLTEINVTSPTGFQEITQQTGFDVADHFMAALEGLL